MNRRDIALASIRREVEESGELTVFALRTAQEHRIGYGAMMAAARDGLRRRARRASARSAPPIANVPEPATSPPTPMSPQDRTTEAKAQIASIHTDLHRHEQLLADAKRSGMEPAEVQRIETLIANDHALVAAWEQRIVEEEENATDPELIDLRTHVDEMSFEDCVLSLISRDGAGPLSVPMQTPEALGKLRDDVFTEARRGRLALRRVEPNDGGARRLPIVMLDGKLYYRDDRLGEFRAVNNPHDRRSF